MNIVRVGNWQSEPNGLKGPGGRLRADYSHMLETLLDRLSVDPHANIDVAEVGLFLSEDEYPGIDLSGYFDRLDELAENARPYLIGSLEQQVEGLCVYLFGEEGFRGNRDEYYDPQNSYLTDVIDRRLGIPITLSVLAMSVGRRAGMAIDGVGLPGHFIARATDGEQSVLFDPFHGGRILSRAECADLVQSITGREIDLSPTLLEATAPRLVVARMLNNLRSIYAEREDYARTARVLRRQRQLMPDDPGVRRDLGVTLVRAGRPGPAISHLKAYLGSEPTSQDSSDVRSLLKRALSDIARWN